jgi:glutathione S-transferase
LGGHTLQESTTMPAITLTYLHAPGRAEPVRLALRLGGIAFTDERIAFPEVMARKAAGALPLGSVPVLTVDGVAMAQTASMLRYAAHLGGGALYPSGAFEAFVVDSVIDSFNDTLSHAMMPSFREPDAEKRRELRAALATGVLAQVLGYTESLAARFDGPFLTGSSLTIADLVIGCQLLGIRSGALDGLHAEHLAPYPRLGRLVDAVWADPRVIAASRG